MPILLGNGLILLGSGLGWAGVRQFHGKSTPWLAILGITAGAIAGPGAHHAWRDNMGLRIVIFSAAQSVHDRLGRGRHPGSPDRQRDAG